MARKNYYGLVVVVCLLVLVPATAFVIALLNTRAWLSEMSSRQVHPCDRFNGRRTIALSRIPQEEIDRGLVVHVLIEHEYRPGITSIVMRPFYRWSLLASTPAATRRDVFAHLSCGARPLERD